jgi:hypothetical protein
VSDAISQRAMPKTAVGDARRLAAECAVALIWVSPLRSNCPTILNVRSVNQFYRSRILPQIHTAGPWSPPQAGRTPRNLRRCWDCARQKGPRPEGLKQPELALIGRAYGNFDNAFLKDILLRLNKHARRVQSESVLIPPLAIP